MIVVLLDTSIGFGIIDIDETIKSTSRADRVIAKGIRI